MSQFLEDLLQQCTVKLTVPGVGYGTGFFVSPGLILTCAHVVKGLGDKSIQVRWQNQENWAEAVVEKSLSDPYDLALLRVILPTDVDPPCVYLGEEVQSRDKLYLFGYPDEGDPQGEPRTFNCDGKTGSEIPWILFNLGQVRPGMSGSPLLNQQTRKVCGIVKFTRDRKIDMGGGAVTSTVILDRFPELLELQRSFHQKDRRWNNLMGDLSNDSEQAQQTVKKILMLSANPDKFEVKSRREEIEKIRNALDRSALARLRQGKQNTVFEPPLDRPDIRAVDLSRELSIIEPHIINISGCENGIENLMFGCNYTGDILSNPEKAMAKLFKLYNKSVKCIVLNGCFLEKQAIEIVQNIEFVIGIAHETEYATANDFLDEFYFQIGSERTIRDAYQLSCSLLERTATFRTSTSFSTILLSREDEIKRQDLEEKLSICDRAIENNQNDIETWKRKASLLRELGRYEEANEVYERASSIAPDDYKIRAEQGDALEQVGKHEKAVIAYEKALELEEKDYKIWWKKGKALANATKYSEANIPYRNALILKPPSPDNYVISREYGFILMKIEAYSDSISMYRESLDLEPKYRASSYEKRQAYRKRYLNRD
jgi:tetratricopeptide (TPR) repeat protein